MILLFLQSQEEGEEEESEEESGSDESESDEDEEDGFQDSANYNFDTAKDQVSFIAYKVLLI